MIALRGGRVRHWVLKICGEDRCRPGHDFTLVQLTFAGLFIVLGFWCPLPARGSLQKVNKYLVKVLLFNKEIILYQLLFKHNKFFRSVGKSLPDDVNGRRMRWRPRREDGLGGVWGGGAASTPRPPAWIVHDGVASTPWPRRGSSTMGSH